MRIQLSKNGHNGYNIIKIKVQIKFTLYNKMAINWCKLNNNKRQLISYHPEERVIINDN